MWCYLALRDKKKPRGNIVYNTNDARAHASYMLGYIKVYP